MSDRLAKFKTTHPDRALRLDRILAPLLGQSGREQGRFAREALDQVEARILAALWGEEEPEVPQSTATATVP